MSRVEYEQKWDDEWADAIALAYSHVPLNLYDEHQKPSERALDQILGALYAEADRCEQAIDALREIAGLHYGSGKQNKTWRELARAALVSLGETE